MFRPALFGLLFVASFALGCGSPSDRLIGTWQADPPKLQIESGQDSDGAPEDEEGRPAPEPPGLAAGLLNSLLDSIDARLTFRRDQSWAFEIDAAGIAVTKTGRWSFVRADGDRLTITLEYDDGGAAQERTITFIDPNTIRTELISVTGVSISESVIFRRVTPGAAPRAQRRAINAEARAFSA